jgi:hypothetical protein
LDRQLPFIPAFVIPYIAWFPFLFAGFLYLAFKNRTAYYETLLQFNIGLIVCYAVYAVYQTYVPRPELIGDSYLLNAVRSVYSTDEPFNCFPSTHVLTSYLMMKAFLRTPHVPRLLRLAVSAMSLTIIASTLFMKQHVLLDAAGAIAVAEGAVQAVRLLRTRLRAGSLPASADARPRPLGISAGPLPSMKRGA